MAPIRHPAGAPPPRVVRVFISSTFLDMQAEREELAKRTFPQLRQLCRERRVEVLEVDLRWGITDEDKAEGKVLPICLAEIERCRPYFLGLLGERYGWVPERLEESLIREYPWLAEHAQHSVTALEILHGVLRDPAMGPLAFFYFRDPAASRRVEDDLAAGAGHAPDSPPARARLAALKERIRGGGFTLREGFPDARALGRLVLEDLWTAIDSRFPADTLPSGREVERRGHEAFAAARRLVYVERPAIEAQLDNHAEGQGPPLILCGPPGSGKSAVLASWSDRRRAGHAEDLVLCHHVASTARSSHFAFLLHGLLEEIGRRLPDRDSPPEALERMAGLLPHWLEKAASQQRTIIVLDGLDQLEDLEGALDLGWLPERLPPRIRLILAARPGRSLDALVRRGWPTLSVAPLTTTEREEIIDAYLAQYRKSLRRGQAERIARAEQTSNPLHLTALLEELRLFGDHAGLEARIGDLLSAGTPEQLYDLILARWEQDYERDRPGLVREAMTLLWTARDGLTENELMALAGSEGGELPAAHWSPLRLAAGESIVDRSGLLLLANEFLARAVAGRYLPDARHRKAAHLRLADFFESREPGARRAEEWPRQLFHAEAWERLERCVTDPDVFAALILAGRDLELLRYWLALGDRANPSVAYRSVLGRLDRPGADPLPLAYLHQNAGLLLRRMGHPRDAVPLLARAVSLKVGFWGAGHPDAAIARSNLAGASFEAGELEDAESLLRAALASLERSLGPDHLETGVCLNNLASCLLGRRRFREAEATLSKALGILEGVLGPEHPNVAPVLGNLARVAEALGDGAGAEGYARRALAVRERVHGSGHPETATSLEALAMVLHSRGDLDAAIRLSRRALGIREGTLGPDHLVTAVSLNHLAHRLAVKGECDEAEDLCRRALGIRGRQLGPGNGDTFFSVTLLAGILVRKGDIENAGALMSAAAATAETEAGPDHPHAAAAREMLAMIREQARQKRV